LMSTVGGASGSLYGTLFISMSKNLGARPLDSASLADIFAAGVESMKQRGKADVGEKTMLDVLIPVAQYLQSHTTQPLNELLPALESVSLQGVEATRDMLATKGRASFLGERSRGCIDAGAQTAQLMLSAIADVLSKESAVGRLS
jgi:phosphoenolpyruvate---glycerone phosphotransferase subunit DhaL